MWELRHFMVKKVHKSSISNHTVGALTVTGNTVNRALTVKQNPTSVMTVAFV